MQRTTHKFFLMLLLLIVRGGVVAAQTTEPLEAAWVQKDIDGVATLLGLFPFENQPIATLKAKLRDTWSS
jgi:hypothetical protein